MLRLAAERGSDLSPAILDSRTLRETPEGGERAGYDRARRRQGLKLHMAVDTLGHLLTLHVTPANADDRAQVGRLAKSVRATADDSVEIALVDQGYAGEKPSTTSREDGTELEIVKLPEAKRGPHPELVEGRAAA